MKTRWVSAGAAVIFIVFLHLAAFCQSQGGDKTRLRSTGPTWGDKLKRSPFSLKEPNLPARILWIGTLQGTWTEMGIQYGQRAGKDIADHWDLDWEDRTLNSPEPWAKSRSSSERQAYRARYLERSWKELSTLSPELCEFYKGIAEGAAKELDKTYYAAITPHHLKILYLNDSEPAIHPNWNFDKDRPEPLLPDANLEGTRPEYDNAEDGCNALYIRGEGTVGGHTYAQRAVQGGMVRTVTVVSYVAIPRDPKARVFWGFGRAGGSRWSGWHAQ